MAQGPVCAGQHKCHPHSIETQAPFPSADTSAGPELGLCHYREAVSNRGHGDLNDSKR